MKPIIDGHKAVFGEAIENLFDFFHVGSGFHDAITEGCTSVFFANLEEALLQFAAGESRFAAVVAPIEVCVGGEKKPNAVKNGEETGDEGPAKEQIDDGKGCLAKVKLMGTEPTQEKGEEKGNNFISP